jgi:hypothetical protein
VSGPPKAASPSTETTQPGPRISGSFLTGRAKPGEGDVRRLTGGRLAIDHAFANRWVVSAGAIWLNEKRETGPDPDLAHHGGALVGFHHRWIDIAAGAGWHSRAPNGETRSQTHVLPAGHLRIGPEDILYAEAALLDFSARSPGLGLLRAGAGSTLGGRGHLFGGWGRSHLDDDLFVFSASVPIATGLSLGIDAALATTSPAHYLVLGGSLGFTFNAPDQGPEPEVQPGDPNQQPVPGTDPFGPGSTPVPLGPTGPTNPGTTPGTGQPLGPQRGFDGDPVQPGR